MTENKNALGYNFPLEKSDKLSDETVNAPPIKLINSNGANCAINSMFQIICNIPALFKTCVRLPEKEFLYFKVVLNYYKTEQFNHYEQCQKFNTLSIKSD